jgi:hypothetical protein
VSKQFRLGKKPRIEYTPGTEEWYQRKIRQEHTKTEYRYTLPWDLERSKALVLLDYKWLGKQLEGAPDNDNDSLFLSFFDEEDKKNYPVRIKHVPHWFSPPRTIGTQSYFTWTYLEACEYDRLTTSFESKLWKDWVGIQATWLEQHQILKRFKKPEDFPKYKPHIQVELDRARFIVEPVTIDSVEFEIPVKLPLVNKHVWDWRPIPTKANGQQFEAAYIKWYLRRRVDEWLAAGGYCEWQKNWDYFVNYSEHPIVGTKLFIKPFYWDLWEDLDHLRYQYNKLDNSVRIIQWYWKYLHPKQKERKADKEKQITTHWEI